MAVRSKMEQKERIVQLLPDNDTGDISAEDVRALLTDIVDSYPEPGSGGTVVPVQQPTTYARWQTVDANLPDAAELIANGTEGDRSVTLPAANPAFTSAIILVAAIPEDRWPLHSRPEMSGVQGGIEMQLLDIESPWAIIQGAGAGGAGGRRRADHRMVAGVEFGPAARGGFWWVASP